MDSSEPHQLRTSNRPKQPSSRLLGNSYPEPLVSITAHAAQPVTAHTAQPPAQPASTPPPTNVARTNLQLDEACARNPDGSWKDAADIEWQHSPSSVALLKRAASPSEHEPSPTPEGSVCNDDEGLVEGETDNDQPKKTKTRKHLHKRRKVSVEAEQTDANGMHHDVNIQPIDVDDANVDENLPLNATDPSADIKKFFTPSVPAADGRKRVSCNTCPDNATLSADHSTLRRHMNAKHRGEYYKWTKENNFLSMLGSDTRQRRQEASEKAQEKLQTQMNEHFPRAKPEDKPEWYTEARFHDVAVEWVVATNQPIQAFEHPSFKHMIDLAARATHGIVLPSRKQTRRQILRMFKRRMQKLKKRLNSEAVKGKINLTCDAWQADNADAYFAVTGHWIDESRPNEWTEEEALFGFTQMNTAHNGTRLGQALFKICCRLDVVNKIGHITCDNASNNMTMMDEFARCYEIKTNEEYDVDKNHIRCFAHIINLATQAFIAKRSRAKYYKSSDVVDDDDIPEGIERDELGLVRTVVVKARSSAQRKELFKSIQEKDGESPLQLILDMKVRWGSTYAMIIRFYQLRLYVEQFITKIRDAEPNAAKKQKLAALAPRYDELERVRFFANLLQHADHAQQAFSVATRPTLHNALPALEELYAQWDKASKNHIYDSFADALEAGKSKIDEYYDRTAASNAHLIAMVLVPNKKLKHFKDNWDADTYDHVVETLQKVFSERYLLLQKNEQPVQKTNHSRLPTKSRNHWVNVDDIVQEPAAQFANPSQSWLEEWNLYITTPDTLPDKMSIVQWWGLNASRYPTWASLARDYLSVMASSVSSERAFSAAGITISKRHNRLKGDIVEALQCLKALQHKSVIFREVEDLDSIEKDMEQIAMEDPVKEKSSSIAVTDADAFSWDQLVESEDDGDDIDSE